MRRLLLGLALALAGLGAPRRVNASPREGRVELARPWLGDRTGILPLERALVGGDRPARERAIERLGALGTPRALELLARALEPSSQVQSVRERLLAVRSLTPYVKEPKVREALVRLMSGISVSAERSEPLYALLRDSAAMALAASGESLAVEALGKALRQPGRVASAAANALAAHPPRDLARVLAQSRAPTAELVSLLESIGDERAFEPLRDIVRHGGPELSAQAALALTRLGNFETVELARRFSEAKLPVLRLAGAEILTLSGEPSAPERIAELLRDPATRGSALELSARAKDARLTSALWSALVVAEAHEQPLVSSLLARSGDPDTLLRLARVRADAVYADAAAYALALAPDPAAKRAIEQAFEEPGPLRRWVRAGVLRRAALGQKAAPEGLDTELERLLASSSRSDRAVGAFGRALASPERARELLRSADELVGLAAARAAPFAGVARDAARLLRSVPPGLRRTQLALALIDPGARAEVPTNVLVELVREAGPAQPIALFALGERDGEAIRPLLEKALGSSEPRSRAHAALGLGRSPEPSALGLLEAAYRFEVDPAVREAIVRALGERPESVRRRTLLLAARLDPAARVRNAAALGLGGVRPSPFVSGVGTLWLVLRGPDAPERRAVEVELPGGLVVPVFADGDGIAALAGLPAGPIALRLARTPAERKAPGLGSARR